MDMKRLEISKLMDEYVDTEFFPEAGTTADAQAVKARVLAKAAPAKRRRRPLKMALLAAALAVGCVLCVAAGLPDTVYHILSGTMSFEQTDVRAIKFMANDNLGLVVYEENRLYIVTEDGRIDITDSIDQETAYIYDDSDPDVGITHYLIVGGTPPYAYGWLEWISAPDPFAYDEDDAAVIGGLAGTPVTAYYARTIYDGGVRCSSGTGRLDAFYSTLYGMNYPWLVTALESLGIGGVNSSGALLVGGHLN